MTAVLNRPADVVFHPLVVRSVAAKRASITDPTLTTAQYNQALARLVRDDRALMAM